MTSPEQPQPTAAALSQPLLVLLLLSFALNAISGIGLWMWPIQAWRVFHGWSIPFFLITLGVVWRVHIVRGWRLRKNVVSGMITLGVFLALIITGWAIYYSGSEKTQNLARSSHTWLGLGISFVLLAHAILGLKMRTTGTT